ncbi:MAG: Type 1 glutamine amidotransferase-like domain-containing protein, partial [Pseudonocardiaceae bacterium]
MVSRIALVGGGFSMDPDRLLDDWVLALTGVARPRVCFVPTASGDAESYVERFDA